METLRFFVASAVTVGIVWGQVSKAKQYTWKTSCDYFPSPHSTKSPQKIAVSIPKLLRILQKIQGLENFCFKYIACFTEKLPQVPPKTLDFRVAKTNQKPRERFFPMILTFPKVGRHFSEGCPSQRWLCTNLAFGLISPHKRAAFKAQRPIQMPGARCGIWHFFLGEFGYALIGPKGLAQQKKNLSQCRIEIVNNSCKMGGFTSYKVAVREKLHLYLVGPVRGPYCGAKPHTTTHRVISPVPSHVVVQPPEISRPKKKTWGWIPNLIFDRCRYMSYFQGLFSTFTLPKTWCTHYSGWISIIFHYYQPRPDSHRLVFWSNQCIATFLRSLPTNIAGITPPCHR